MILQNSLKSSRHLLRGARACSSSSSSCGNSGSRNGDDTSAQLVKRILRECNAAEAAACGFYAGQNLVKHGRPDIASMLDQEHANQERVRALMPEHRVRPSLLQGVLGSTGFALGAAAAVLPRDLHARIMGAVAEIGEELYNDQLRELREQAEQEQAPVPEKVREVVRDLRDVERAPDGVPPVPDIVSLQRDGIAGVGLGGAAALAVKVVGRTAINLAGKL